MKHCLSCDTNKPLNAFHKSKCHKDGLHPYCAECKNARNRSHYKSHKKAIIAANYGITVEEYDRLLAIQDFKCALCDTPQDQLERGLYVDHDHSTGQVRGLLCSLCNTAIGILGDNIEGLQKAINYLSEV